MSNNKKIVLYLMLAMVVLAITQVAINFITVSGQFSELVKELIVNYREMGVTIPAGFESTMNASLELALDFSSLLTLFTYLVFAWMYFMYYKKEKLTKKTSTIFFGFSIYFLVSSISGSGIVSLAFKAVMIAMVVLLFKLRKELQ